MKKLILSLIISCLAVCGYAQEHLLFKGIPFEGSLTSFCQKLKSKGYIELERETNYAMLKGDFTGRQVTLGVGASDEGQNVYVLVVIFEANSEWKSLVDIYDYYKNIYTRKYGEPSTCVENNPARYDSNTALMAQLYQGTVVYGSAWEVLSGEIQISIEKSNEAFEGVVMIRYRDSHNLESKIQNDLDEI